MRSTSGGGPLRPAAAMPSGPRKRGLKAASVDVGALDQERDPNVGAELVEVLAPQAGADDVHGADVPQRALRLLERLLGGVIRGLLRAADQLDDLDYGHDSSL